MDPVNPLARQDLDLILEQTAPLWEEARGKRILVTGGTGFFGCWLVESFCHIAKALSLEANLVVLSRNPAEFIAKCPHLAAEPYLSFHTGDVRSFIFPEGKFQYLLHCAAETSSRVIAADLLAAFSTIVLGTERTLQFAEAAGVRKYLLTSSGAIYGKQPPILSHVPESYTGAPDPLDRNNIYGEGKRAAELLCALYAKKSGIECKVARCWAFCGPHLPLDQHFAVGNFIGAVLNGKAIDIKGDGTPRRSYLYAADLAVWLWTILFRAPSLMPINVGSAHDVSIRELAEIVANTLDPKTKICAAGEPIAGDAASRYVPCVDRARELLGLNETVRLEEAIRRTASWHMRKPLHSSH